jgi:hypothetical protein
MNKRKLLKIIARFTVFFRMTIIRDCRVALIEYKYQTLKNCYYQIDTDISQQKQILEKQDLKLKQLNIK